MKYLRWIGVMPSLLLLGVLGGLLAPLPSHALTVTIDGVAVQIGTTSSACTSGYNLCSFIRPGQYGSWIVGDVSSTNKARIMIGDNSSAGSLDLLKLTGITFTPVVTAGTKTVRVVVTHTYNAGGGNPAGDYAWGYGMAGYLDPPSTENIVGDQLKQSGQGNFAGKIAALGLGLDTGVFASPSTLNLNGSVTKSRAATVVMPACNTGSSRCAPTITQTFTLTVAGADKLVLSDSVIAAGGICRQVDQVIPIPPHLYALMLKLDPNAPNDINQLSAWLAKMGEKYLKSPKQKELLAWLIKELDKWLANTVPGTCPEIEERINAVVVADLAAELVAAQAAGAVPAEPGGTITITKNTSIPTEQSFAIRVSDSELTTTYPINMSGMNNQILVVPVAAGTYNLSEQEPLPTGWTLTSSSCGAGGPTTGVVVPAEGNVDCIFTNTFSAPPPAAASFMGLGDIPGGAFGSNAREVSSDGSAVVGEGLGVIDNEASRWTATTGMVSLTPGVYGISEAVSDDGSVVVGWMINPDPLVGNRAFRWRSGALVDLGTLPTRPGVSSHSFATDVSANGTVVVGASDYGPSGGGFATEAFRWTQDHGMVGLGTLPGATFIDSHANAVSSDGSVIIGWATTTSGPEMFRWTSATGIMQGLGVFRATPTNVSRDGVFVTGFIANASFTTDAFRWSQATGLEILPVMDGATPNDSANGISDDGSIIVGKSGNSPTADNAVIWRKTGGNWNVQRLKDVVTVPAGWILLEATGISADGRTIVGLGQNPAEAAEAWRIQLP